MVIDLDKRYQTRDGRAARIFALTGGDPRPIVGQVETSSGYWHPYAWHRDGTVYGSNVEDPLDLTLVPEPDVIEYVALRPSHGYSTLEAAKQASNPSPIRHYLKTTYNSDRTIVKSMEIVE